MLIATNGDRKKMRGTANLRKIQKGDLERYRANYLAEMDGIALYCALAAEKNEKRSAIFEKLARSPLGSGMRMLGIGLLASAITFAVAWSLGGIVAELTALK
jgi:hypothetical protein